jgi:hypothetical protein
MFLSMGASQRRKVRRVPIQRSNKKLANSSKLSWPKEVVLERTSDRIRGVCTEQPYSAGLALLLNVRSGAPVPRKKGPWL